ncbi:MAG TPA: hypothetical protein VGS57_08555 [Thermoanaerobaculia bacterium]|jgi:hypothetical protein|nr:hypothetical protein [Thermoanaerobaculia bacterium]
MAQSNSLIQAVDGIRDAILHGSGQGGILSFHKIATGPYERVLGFSTKEFIKLEGGSSGAFFSSTGVITDVWGTEIPGTRVATKFPVVLTKEEVGKLFQWPNPQTPPFEKVPPVPDQTNAVPTGTSLQSYFWNNDKDSIVTVGPAVAKIALLNNGAGQFWVAAVGVISQGTGVYEGCRGQQGYVGSSYIDPWPSEEELPEKLAAGINVISTSWIKLVYGKEVAPPKKE